MKKSWQIPTSRNVQETIKHPLKINAWGCFSSNGFGKLYLFREDLNADSTITIYEQALLPSIKVCFPQPSLSWFLLEDNDPKHRAKKCAQWKGEKEISVLPWPSYSPDLNPIENVWGLMKLKLASKNPLTIRGFESEISKIWKSFNLEYASNLVSSMERRITCCITTHGDYTGY